MPETTLQRVIRVIAATQHFPAEKTAAVTLDSTFADLGIDSLDGINVVFALENEFDVSIPDDAAKSMHGMREVVDGIEQLLAAKSEPATPEPS